MKQYVVDAFTDRVFHGNQAAVCVLDAWLPEELMMNITRENNFSETAFTVREGESSHVSLNERDVLDSGRAGSFFRGLHHIGGIIETGDVRVG